ncbi:MAG: hypothetical protein CMH98_18045 [Oceanospirillaceae bacterium]|nr:hypothetical protein [Oceanospirillaceae bacterium]|tara:strand:+ start:5318 stop:5959 length:642 start_codon:yes stop_codon:yes gene_type:complete
MTASRTLSLTAILLLSGCSLLPDDNGMAYLDAEEKAATRVPEGMQLNTAQAYPIPSLPVTPATPTEFEVPMPSPYVEEDTETVSSLTEYQSTDSNPRLEQDGAGTMILRLDGGFANNWAKVTEALGASSLKLTDLNRSTGTYYLEITTREAEEDRGWWDSLWGSDEPETAVYLLKMNRARNGVYLSLLTDTDTLAGEALTQDVLEEIKRQLSQ